MLYVRKIKSERWIDSPKYDSDSISDLNTTDRGLSVWRLRRADDKENMDKIALALAMTSDKPVGIMLILIDTDKIKDHRGRPFKIDVSEQEGATRFKKMKDEHVNFILPSIFEMGYLAATIHELLKDTSNIVFYNETELTDLFFEACNKNEISPEDIKDSKWAKILKKHNSDTTVSV